MSRLRVGCVGTGFIAGRHLAALSAFDDVEVVAVADADKDRAERTAERYGATAHDDGTALIEREDLDAVWLCVPPFAHGPLEQAALDRDLPFFVEKPLSTDLATPVRIAEAVREKGLLTCVGYHWRSVSVVDRALGLLADNPVQLLSATWLDSTPPAPWWSRRSGSGGQLVEQTTHLVDLARLLVGEVETVQALDSTVARAAWPDADVPTASAVLLRFASGAIGTVASSCVLDRRHDVGVRLVTAGRTLDLRERALSDHELRVEDRLEEQRFRTTEDPISREDRAFLDALASGSGDVPASYDQGLRTQAVVCAADRSAAEGGTPVHVETLLARSASAPQPSGDPRG